MAASVLPVFCYILTSLIEDITFDLNGFRLTFRHRNPLSI